MLSVDEITQAMQKFDAILKYSANAPHYAESGSLNSNLIRSMLTELTEHIVNQHKHNCQVAYVNNNDPSR